MSLFGVHTWLKAPEDRDVITRWTVGDGEERRHELEIPPPPDPDRFVFMALGDSGAAESAGPILSPQEAVAREMAADAALPGSAGEGRMVLHMGDVVYVTGEYRLYDRNFRRPYADFLTPDSTVDQLTFRLPFLPVPGNHDYYDLHGWFQWLARVPVLGAGMRALVHELFAFSMPEGGSDMGRAFMRAFVDAGADTREAPLSYLPGERTRLPNRYYRFRYGNVDFFALDSNTLDAPAPWKADPKQVRENAARRLESLEVRAKKLDGELRRNKQACDRWQEEHHMAIAGDPTQIGRIIQRTADVVTHIQALEEALRPVEGMADALADARQEVVRTERRWQEAASDLREAVDADARIAALRALDDASDDACASLRALERGLSILAEGPDREAILAARAAMEAALTDWTALVEPLPAALCGSLRKLSEEALDVQREIALEKRRTHYRPDDYDEAQVRWLQTSLEEAARERPDAWRVVYMHHPLYSSIVNHAERPDVQGVRENLMAVLRERVHLVLAGHAHAFEWFRSDRMPNAGLFVTGGGGMVSLRPSLLDPARFHRYRERYASLREHGATECVVGGNGPTAEDGAGGLLYHYLRIEVRPEAITVRPVGIRGMGKEFRREEPMPVYHAAALTVARPTIESRLLIGVEVRRDRPPRPLWR